MQITPEVTEDVQAAGLFWCPSNSKLRQTGLVFDWCLSVAIKSFCVYIKNNNNNNNVSIYIDLYTHIRIFIEQ